MSDSGVGSKRSRALARLADPLAAHVMPSRFQSPAHSTRGGSSTGGHALHSGTASLRGSVPGSRLTVGGTKRLRGEEGTSATVLEEEVYEAAMGRIIERDYFPDLPRLQQQLAWLRALDSGDAERIAEMRESISSTVRRAGTFAAAPPTPAAPRELLATGDATPLLRHAGNDVRPRAAGDAASVASWTRGVRDRVSMAGGEGEGEDDAAARAAAQAMYLAQRATLDEFTSKYTSEDNASFGVNEKKKAAAHARAHWWLYEHMSSSKYARLLAGGDVRLDVQLRALRDENVAGVRLLTNGGQLGGDLHGVSDTWRYRPQSALFFPPRLSVSRNICGLDIALPRAALLPALEASTAPRALLENGGGSSGASTAVPLLPHVSLSRRALLGLDLVLPSRRKRDGGVVHAPLTRTAATRLAPTALHSALLEDGGAQRARDAAGAAAAALGGGRGALHVRGYEYVTTPGPTAAAASSVSSAFEPPGVGMVWGTVFGTPAVLGGGSGAPVDAAALIAAAAQPARLPDGTIDTFHPFRIAGGSGRESAAERLTRGGGGGNASALLRGAAGVRAAATPLFPSTPGSVAARTMVSHASYRSSGHVSTRQQLAAMTPAARALVATVAAEAAGRRSSSGGGGAASAPSAASPAISLRKA